MLRNYSFEVEGHKVTLLGQEPFRRWLCNCAEYRATTTNSGYAFCRHTQLAASRFAGHPMRLDPHKQVGQVLRFPRRPRPQAKTQ